jgi:hypothetical protein
MSSISSGKASDTSRKGAVAAGVTGFAGVLLMLNAVMQILQGFVALGNDGVLVTGVNYEYELSVTAWGWIHLIVGLLGLAVGIAIIAGQTVGYLAGIAVAFLGAATNFAFLPYYPFWSVLVIAFDVLVIWALCTQLGRDRVGDDHYTGSATDSSAPAQSERPAQRR